VFDRKGLTKTAKNFLRFAYWPVYRLDLMFVVCTGTCAFKQMIKIQFFVLTFQGEQAFIHHSLALLDLQASVDLMRNHA